MGAECPARGTVTDIYIYHIGQRLAPLQVLLRLIKSLILIIFVIPEKVLICYCPAQKYKCTVCPCIDPPYYSLMSTVLQVRLPFTIGMDGVIPGVGSRRPILARQLSWSIWTSIVGLWQHGLPWIPRHRNSGMPTRSPQNHIDLRLTTKHIFQGIIYSCRRIMASR